MRIVDRKTFLAMPSGTVFAKFAPCWFGDLHIKGDSLDSNDFIAEAITDAFDNNGSEQFADRCYEMKDKGASYPMTFDATMRDGLFDDDQLFAVWDRSDVTALIERLSRALADSA